MRRGDLLFVYGTLRQDSDHPMAARLRAAAHWRGPARWRGALYDMGAHPAAVRAAEGSWVRGDLFELHEEAIVAVLDTYEDCGPDGTLGPLGFVRACEDVVDASGALRSAWMYRFTRSVTGGRRIADGDYLADVAGRPQP